MKLRRLQACILIFFLGVAAVPFAQTQTQTQDPSVRAKRRQAMDLFDQGNRLQALPLLEELAQKSPGDEEVVVALAASLVTHAATVTDRQAAAQERLRAKNLLEKSGSSSAL